MWRSSSRPGELCPSRAVHTDLGESCNSLNSLEVATTSEGIERQSCLWTTGVSTWGQVGSSLAMSMSMVKLEGVGEGMFVELAEDMVM